MSITLWLVLWELAIIAGGAVTAYLTWPQTPGRHRLDYTGRHRA